MAVVDLRYARALEAVVEEQQLSREDARQQLEEFLASYGTSAPLREVLGDPSIPQQQKVGFLDALARRTGMSPTIRNFVAVVVQHNRLHELRAMVDAFLQLADKDTGIAEAEVISARPLDEAARQTLEQSIAQLAGGTSVRASYREDPALLGGAVVKLGSTVYDGSVRGQLEQMRQRMANATA